MKLFEKNVAKDCGALGAWRRLLWDCVSDKWLVASVLSITVLMNFVHLSDFWLSIDEELASFTDRPWVGWIAQGRWGMGLINVVLPDYAPVPFISTFIFILCLAIAALLISKLLTNDRYEALVFSGFFVASPIWLHVSEFNTLAAGMGIGLLVVAFAMHLVRVNRTVCSLGAGVCVGFALGVYQALIVVYAIGCIVLVFSSNWFWPRTREQNDSSRQRSLYLVSMSFLVAAIFYLGMQKMFLDVTHQQSTYIDTYMQLSELSTDFVGTASRILDEIGGIVLGTDPLYLGWGRVLLLLPGIGFLCGLFVTVRSALSSPEKSIASVVSILLILACCSGLIVLAAGRMPIRALIGFPFLFALLALTAYRAVGRAIRFPYWIAFGYMLLLSGWIGASLFYADRVARMRDQVLATNLVSAIHAVVPTMAGRSVPLVVVGERTFPSQGVARQVQVFGQSFFAQDGGNPHRVAAYLRYLGMDELEPMPITHLSQSLSALRDMPAWPTSGSVAMLDGTLVIKFGDISYQQDLLLRQAQSRQTE